MPIKPKRPCAKCGRPTHDRYCEKCKPVADETRKRVDRERDKPFLHLYSTRWKKARRQHLMEFPLCAECQRQGRVTAATVVDHIVPHKGNMDLFWDRSNWESMCAPCHNSKTAREDGGYGNNGR